MFKQSLQSFSFCSHLSFWFFPTVCASYQLFDSETFIRSYMSSSAFSIFISRGSFHTCVSFHLHMLLFLHASFSHHLVLPSCSFCFSFYLKRSSAVYWLMLLFVCLFVCYVTLVVNAFMALTAIINCI